MKILALDTENTTWNKGNPFDVRNFNVCYSWASSDGHSGASRCTWSIQDLVDSHDVIVGFNLKYDLHWLRKLGVSIDKPVWDCQVGEFILSNQTERFPSLNGAAEKYGFPLKYDVVSEEYWKKGINTHYVPWPILSEYAEYDAVLTLKVYNKQMELMTPAQKRLMRLCCMDTIVLAEMEWNGLLYNEKLCAERSKEIDDKVQAITEELQSVYPDVPINFNSGDQLSAFLYGGTVYTEGQEFIGFFKTGDRAGQPKFKKVEIAHQLPRMFEPLKGSELKKEGYYATNEDTLKKLKGSKKVKKYVDMILELSKLEKLNGTYYAGLPSLNEEMHWEPGVLHGQLNQCVAATGRLSASKPNQQNFASDMLDVFVTRMYE